MKKAEAYWPLILLMALIKFVLPIFLQSPVYELQRDELLYYQQGQHPDLGYLENPPFLAWLGWISSWFGGSEAWIKLWPSLFGAATVVVTSLITAELGGNRFAQFLASLGIIVGAYLRIHFLFQPNMLEIFSWTTAVYFLLKYINTKNTGFIYGIALSLVFGWWCKYSVLFMVLAMILGILLTRHRVMLALKQTWMAIFLGLIIVIPNIWWQYQHNWPLVHHMKELQETQLQYLAPADFLKDQVLMLLPVAFVWITGLVWALRSSTYRILGYIYLIIIILLISGNGKPYYSLGVYPMLLAAGAVALEKSSAVHVWKRYAITLLVMVFSIPFIPLLLPTAPPPQLAAFYEKYNVGKTGILKWEDQQDHPLPQDFADMLGWKELTEKTERFYFSLPASTRHNTVIYGRHYGHAGALTYYGKDKTFRRKVITDNGSFLLWVSPRLYFEHLVFIGHTFPAKDDMVFQHFQRSEVIDSVTNPYSRQFGDKIIFFERIDSTGLRLANEELTKERQRFRRH